jgi:hypothetical protein
VNNSLPDVTFDWQISSGSGVSIVSGTSSRSVTVQATSAGSATLLVTVEQGGTTLVTTDIFFRDTTITVQSPAATPTPITPPTNPGPVPTSIPNSQGVVAPEGTTLVSSKGLQTGTNPQVNSLRNDPVIYIPTGSVSDFYGVNVNSVPLSGLAPMPSGILLGSSAADFFFVDDAGTAQSNFRLLKAADVCLPSTPDDLVFGYGNAYIFRYNSTANQWVRLNTTYNAITGQLCAKSSNFSTFAIGVEQVQATATPDGGVTPPATGDWTPGPSMLLFAGLLGFVLVGGGAVTMRRARKSEIDINQ